MVLAFSEEQKQEIEAKGVTVIELKRILYRMEKAVDEAWQVTKEAAEKITKTFITFKEKFLETMDGMRMAIEVIRDYYNYPTSRRYKIVKTFGKCTGTDISFGWNITWKIKRWLTRRYC